MADALPAFDELPDETPQQKPAAPPPAPSFDALPSETPPRFDDIQDQSWPGYLPTIGSEAAQHAVTGVGEAMQGIPEMAGDYHRRTLDTINRIDRGEKVSMLEDTIGYQAMDAEHKALARADVEKVTAAAGPTPAPQESGLYKAGEAVKQFGKTEFPTTPTQDVSFTGRGAALVGGMLPIMAASAVAGPQAGMAFGAAQMGLGAAHEQAEAARAKGATPEAAAEAARTGAILTAATGVVPLGFVLKPIERAAPGIADWARARLLHAGQSGVVFATLGEAQEWIGQEIAKKYYDPDAGYSFDVSRALGSLFGGAFIGFLTPTPYRGAAAAKPAAEPAIAPGETAKPDELRKIFGEEGQPPPAGPPAPAAPAPEDESILGGPRPPPATAPTGDDYVNQAMRNLRSTSRTAAGILDVSSTPGKADRMVEGLAPETAASNAINNYSGVVRDLYNARDELPTSGGGMSQFIDNVAQRVNDGIVRPDALPRVADTNNRMQTAAADLPMAHAQFAHELVRRLNDPNADPVETAAWIEWRANILDHFWSDGTGKTSRALAAIPLMRAGLPLPIYPPSRDFYALAKNETRVDPRAGGVAYLTPGWERFNNYYHQMVDPRGTLQEMIDGGAPPAAIENHPMVLAAQAEADKRIPTGTQEDFENPEWQAARTYNFAGEQVQGWDNAVARLTDSARKFAGQGEIGKDHHAVIVIGPPAAGKSSIAEPLARRFGAAIVDADEAKKVITEYHNGIGTSAVHEESSFLAKGVLKNIVRAGENIILPKVGQTPDCCRGMIRTLKGLGYKVDLIHVSAAAEVSQRRNIQRFLNTGRLVNPKYVREVGDNPRRTAYLLRGEADDFADFDTSREPAEIVEGSGAIADAVRTGQDVGRGAVGRPARTPGGTEEGLIGRPVTGMPVHRVSAADRSSIEVAPRVVEAADLLTSQDQGYDQSLQPRQRDRAASQAQVRDIATNLDPARLGQSTEADRGAPIVGPDGMVESGNGRVLAIRDVYARDGSQAAAYRDFLTGMGVDTSAYRHPVLVRQRTTPLNEVQRQQFTLAANHPATLAMSAPERAMADARNIDTHSIGLIRNPNDLAAPENRDFVRRFVAALPQGEQGAMADTKGRLSAEGLARVRNAVLARAYGDADVVARVAESTDDDIKSISNALTAAAPAWARLRAAVDDGRVREDIDVTPDLLEAVKRTADLRGRGEKLDTHLAQQDAFDRMPEVVEGFMRMFYDPKGRRAAGAQRISGALRFYAEEARKVSAEKGLGLDIVPIEPRDIQRLAIEREWEDVPAEEISDRGGLGDGTRGAPVGGEARGLWLGEGLQGAARRGHESYIEAAVRAQQPTVEELRVGGGRPPIETIEGRPGEGVEARIYPNADGKRFNVTMFDRDSGRTLPSIKIVPTLDEARTAARRMASGDEVPTPKIENLSSRPSEKMQAVFGKFKGFASTKERGFLSVSAYGDTPAEAQQNALDKLRREFSAKVARLEGAPVTEPGAEGKPQLVIPGAERISAAELLRRRAAEPLRATRPQEIPGGLFGDLERQTDLEQAIAKAQPKPPALDRDEGRRREMIGRSTPLSPAEFEQLKLLNRKHQLGVSAMQGSRSAAAELADLHAAGDWMKTEHGTQSLRRGDFEGQVWQAKGAWHWALNDGGVNKPHIGGPMATEEEAKKAVTDAIKGGGIARSLTAGEKRPTLQRTERVPQPRQTQEAFPGKVSDLPLEPAEMAPKRQAKAKKQPDLFSWEATNEHPGTKGAGAPALGGMAPGEGRAPQGGRPTEPGAPIGGNIGPTGNRAPDETGLPGVGGEGGGTTAVHPPETGEPGVLPDIRGGVGIGGQGTRIPAQSTIRLPDVKPSEAPSVPALDYRITDETELGKGPESVKFNDNIAAIETLKKIEREDRRPTPDEQRILARYVGWGGMANAFTGADGKFKPAWEERGNRLASLLNKDELSAARHSTPNAHYTSKPIVDAMWKIAGRLGFKGGMALESSMGTGNFIGLIPDNIAGRTKFVGVELDSITARIAKALYPQQTIIQSGFQRVPLPDGEFTLNIGNPPFGKESLRFQDRPELNGLSIHNQFFLAGLDALQPGGLHVAVVSHFLLDANDSTARERMAVKADLLGAIRLPDTAFKENARTEVVTDIVVMQRRTPDEQKNMEGIVRRMNEPGRSEEAVAGRKAAKREFSEKAPWVDTAEMRDPLGGEPMPVNSYFANKPEMVIGRLERSGTMHAHGEGQEVNVKLDPKADFNGLLNKAVDRLPRDKIDQDKKLIDQTLERFKTLSDSLRIAMERQEPGHLEYRDGGLTQVMERETPRGEFELTRRPVDPTTPWSRQLIMGADGRWYTMEPAVDAKGKKLKQGTRLVYERKYFPNNEVPGGMRLGQERFENLSELTTMRDLLKKQIMLETEDAPAKEMEGNRDRLAAAYRAYAGKRGLLNDPRNMRLLNEMPDGPLLMSLENGYRSAINEDRAKRSGQKARPASAQPAAILSRRVIQKYEPPTKAASPADAVAISRSEYGRINIDRIAGLLGIPEDKVAEALTAGDKPLAYHDPETQQLEPTDFYLSGQVRKKLAAARLAGLDKNVRALEAVQPEEWTADQVTPLVGSNWIQTNVYEDFAKHLLGIDRAAVNYSKATNSFNLLTDEYGEGKRAEWGTPDMPPDAILRGMLNSHLPKVIRETKDDPPRRREDKEASALVVLKAKEIENAFADWVFSDGDRRRALVKDYNDKFNTRTPRQHDGSYLTLPGKSPEIALFRHVINGIARGVYERNMLFDWVVGSGKTFGAVGRIMERRRLGLSQKPMVVVPNHLVSQWTAEALRLYPGAKILAAGKNQFTKQNRRRLFAKIATGDWDMVIVPHSSFGFIGIHPDTELRFLDEQLRIAREAVTDAENAAAASGMGGFRKPYTVKEAERLVSQIESRMDAIRGKRRDGMLTFEQMGIDDLTVDEAHEFKNLFYSSRMQDVRGMGDKSGSQKAFDLYNKIKVLNDSPTGSTVFLTGTPISNSAVEMYSMMRYLAAKDLNQLGMEHFDAWRSQFVSAEPKWEPTEAGGLKEVTRLGRSWSNMRALMDLYHSFTDSVTQEDINRWFAEDNNGAEFPIPKVAGGERETHVVQPTPAQRTILGQVIAGFEDLPNIKDPDERNAERLRLMDRARKVSLDARAVDPRNPSKEENGKLEAISDQVAGIYKKWTDDKGTQLIFLDRSVPKAKGDDKIIKAYDDVIARRDKALADHDEEAFRRANEDLEKFNPNEIAELRTAQHGGWNAYQQIKDNLIARGVPADEIRFVQEANNDAEKQQLFDAVNDGEVRVLIGSTQRMGAGTNVQNRIVAIHHGDVTWKPSDIEQREGRGIRQGNSLYDKYGSHELEIHNYVTERTIDAKMWDLNSEKLRMVNGIRKYDGSFNMEFADEDAISMAEIAALASGDPLLMERVKLSGEIEKLEIQERGFRRKMNGIEDALDRANQIVRDYPKDIEQTRAKSDAMWQRINALKDITSKRSVAVEGKPYRSAFDAMEAVEKRISEQKGKDENAKYEIKVDGKDLTNKEAISSAIGLALGDTNPFEAKIGGETYGRRWGAVSAIMDKLKVADLTKLKEPKTIPLGRMLGADLVAEVAPYNKESVRLTLALMDDGKTIAANDELVNIEKPAPLSALNGLEKDVYNVATSRGQWMEDRLEKAKKSIPELTPQLKTESPVADRLAEMRDKLRSLIETLDQRTRGQQTRQPDEALQQPGEAIYGEMLPPGPDDVEVPKARTYWELADGRAALPPATRIERLGPETVAHVSDKYSENETKIAEAVREIGERMAPQAQVMGTKALRQRGGQIWGAFVNSPAFPHLIAWSLEKGERLPSIAVTIRHEIVHHLKAAGLIRPEEWDALTKAAKAGDWIKKYGIDETRNYGHLSEAEKLEEAIAEHFGTWRTERSVINEIKDPFQRLVKTAYNKIDLFFKRVAAAARQFLGQDATANDVFTRMETGEVGRRQSEQIEAQKRYFEAAQAARQTETPAFKRWFGDSKVVDKNDQPMTVYHGTPIWEGRANGAPGSNGLGAFNAFDRLAAPKFTGRRQNIDNVGSWFFENPEHAEMFAGQEGTTYPVKLSIKNPWRPTWDQFVAKHQELRNKAEFKAIPQGQRTLGAGAPDRLRSWLKQQGYDGIYMKDVDADGSRVWVALDPEQIKSATGNRGAFEPFSEDIRAQTPGGEARERRQAAAVPPRTVWEHLTAASDNWRKRSAELAEHFGVDKFVRGAQIRWTPMAARDATVESRAVVKRAMNAQRQSRESWNKANKYLEKTYTPKQLEKMWSAADEQGVAMQQGRPTEGIGYDRLTPQERADTIFLQNKAQALFNEARDLKMVQGEGLPSYVPRMFVRMAEGGLERGVGPGAKVVRDIRTLALANAKLEDAIAAKRLIETIKEIGVKSGNPTVNEGAAPIRRQGTPEGLISYALDQAFGRNFKTTTPQLKHRKYLTTEESEAAAGRVPVPDKNAPTWFTLNNPAFQILRPKMIPAETQTIRDVYKAKTGIDMRPVVALDNDDNPIMEKVPIYVRSDFEGPLLGMMQGGGAFERGLMKLKGMVMSVIMFSPLIHNQVEWGRALPVAPGKVLTLQIYMEGNKTSNDPALMREAISGGAVPIGGHGFMQDVVSIAEAPSLAPGRSVTAKGIGYGAQALGHMTKIYDPKTGADTVRRSIDWFGNVWHNVMLWDRIRDLQMGIWSHIRQDLIENKGHHPFAANVAAAHFANRYAGALPLEAMSGLARGIANVMLFSRTFTLGNIGAYKDAITGLPRDAQALIQDKLGWDELQKTQSYVKRKSRVILAIDAGLYYATLSAMQSAFHVAGPGHTMMTLGGMIAGGALGGRGGPYGRLAATVGLGAAGYGLASVLGASPGTRKLEDELEGYWNRFEHLAQRTYEHPAEVLGNPFKSLTGLLSTAENEPGFENRILWGYNKDGTAEYMRLSAGKVTEDLIGWITKPMQMLHDKLSTFAKPIDQWIENNIGFGRNAYDATVDSPVGYVQNVIKLAGMLVMGQLPIDMAESLSEYVHGGPTAEQAGQKSIGQVSGLTFRRGYPGSPEGGVIASAEQKQKYRVQQAMPGIRDQIRNGDLDGAFQKMRDLGIPKWKQGFTVESTLTPGRISKRRMQEFMQFASPEEQRKFFESQENKEQDTQTRAEGGAVDPPEDDGKYGYASEAPAADYDYKSAREAGVVPDARGHMPDTYKLPNHITFSDESIYHGVDGNEGGHWSPLSDDRWSFTPGPTNLQHHSMQELRDYFKKYEPGNVLGQQMANGGGVDWNAYPRNRAHGGRVDPQNIDRAPTQAQKAAGNYAKDHLHFQGMPLTIENAKGSMRRGVGRDGNPWECKLPCHYGYIKRTEGADGDHVDVNVGPHQKASHIYVIDQVDAETKKFDEHKAFLGFGSEAQAVRTYEKSFSDGKGRDRIGKVTGMTVAQFRDWLHHGDTTKPFAHVASRKERVRDLLERHLST